MANPTEKTSSRAKPPVAIDLEAEAVEPDEARPHDGGVPPQDTAARDGVDPARSNSNSNSNSNSGSSTKSKPNSNSNATSIPDDATLIVDPDEADEIDEAEWKSAGNDHHRPYAAATMVPDDSVAAARERSDGTRSSDESPKPEVEPTFQHTLAGPATISGKGIFLGDHVRAVIKPAPVNHGIVFERTDLADPVRIPARITNVTARARRTTLRAEAATVETVEHCLSALAGLGIDNALIEVDGPELPCGDGSALPYTDAINEAGGVAPQESPRLVHRISEPITVQEGDAVLVALPSEQHDLQILFDLDYGGHDILRRQLHAFRMSHGDYLDEIAPARTFSLETEAQALWDRGMCRHLKPSDVLVIGDDGPIENEFRFDNEPARHKVLDLIGDLVLLGRPVQGRIVAYKSGHSLNHELTRRLSDQIAAQRRRELLAQRPAMDNRAIQKLLHHRYPMLMVDRVLEFEGDRRAIGIKNVTVNEPFFQGHYPGTPIMPGVMIVEAMAQLSGLLLSSVLEHTGRLPVLLSLDKVKLRRQVVPGDTLVLEAETVRAQARMANVKCKAWVGDELAAEARVKFIMVDAEDD